MAEYVFNYDGWAEQMRTEVFGIAWCFGLYKAIAEVMHERIVRCRDCDFSQKDGTCCILFAGWEPIEGGDEYELVSADVEPDGFCKWGARREDA